LQIYNLCNLVANLILNKFIFSGQHWPDTSKFVQNFSPRVSLVSDLLLIKILLMPPLIAGVTLCVRKWGEGLGGWIGGFPWVAGPISFFIALEHGAAFASSTIPSALMGSIGTFFFALVYSVVASRLHWFPTLIISYLAFFIVAMFSLGRTPPLVFALVLNVGVLAGILYVYPKPKAAGKPRKHPFYDIPLRMFVATFFVILVTQAAEKLGPTWSGILTPFPIMTSTLAVFTHAQQGSQATSRVLYGLLLTGFGFIAFLMGVALLVPVMPVALAYGLLAVLTMGINGASLKLIR
jgi:hypothetical protein